MKRSCLFFHKWSQWSKPYKVEYFWLSFEDYSKSDPYLVTEQSRTCERCGKVEIARL